VSPPRRHPPRFFRPPPLCLPFVFTGICGFPISLLPPLLLISRWSLVQISCFPPPPHPLSPVCEIFPHFFRSVFFYRIGCPSVPASRLACRIYSFAGCSEVFNSLHCELPLWNDFVDLDFPLLPRFSPPFFSQVQPNQVSWTLSVFSQPLVLPLPFPLVWKCCFALADASPRSPFFLFLFQF